MEKIVADIIFDFQTKARLRSQMGNAILVASSIYEASKYYNLFLQTELKNKCAIITLNPHVSNLKLFFSTFLVFRLSFYFIIYIKTIEFIFAYGFLEKNLENEQ